MRIWLSAVLLVFGLLNSAHAVKGHPPNVSRAMPAAPPELVDVPRMPERQAERILDFFSDVTVQANGDLIVRERIRVNAQGREIERGLMRDFPTRYQREDGTAVKVGFKVLGVTRNGYKEPYKELPLSNGTRIRIGDADSTLNPGEHEYEISYLTTRQLGFFQDFDELYWNVTGTGWTFPIDHASARITLPSPAGFLQTSVYTGRYGSTEKNARVVSSTPGQIVFETTEPLGTREGLTVAAAWPKGIVSPPSFFQILFYFLRDNIGLVVSAAGFVILALYYIVAVLRTRRRSQPVIVPLYGPPSGMCAPAVRYVARQQFDNQTFVVGMLELISIRAMRMVKKTEDVTTFERTEGVKDNPTVGDPFLSGMLGKLFGKEKSFDRDGLEGPRFGDTNHFLETSLQERYQSALFNPNRKIASRGMRWWLLYAAACFGAAWLQNPESGKFVGVSFAFTIPSLAVLTLIVAAWRYGKFNWGMCIFAVLFVCPFLLGGVAMLLTLTRPAIWGAMPGLLPMLMLPVVVSAYRFLKGYTEEGYRIMDQIEGFKQYLTVAEGPRLQALVTPQEKLEVYERCLPFAVALDVGKAWAAAFAGFFAGTAAMAAVEAMQQNYAGHDMLRDNPNTAIKDFSRDVAPHRPTDSADASSGPPGSSGSWSSGGSSSSSSSSSSSGSSGGGSSGGGGGGGGGSGW